jgi:predicted flap endonuclease-1-like 5' DNA nuclease
VLILAALVAIALAAFAGFYFGSRLRAAPRAAEPVSGAPLEPARPSLSIAAAAAPSPAPFDAAAEAHVGGEKARIIRSRDAEAAALRAALASADESASNLRQSRRAIDDLATELAAAHAETARYRQLIVDIENNAPPPILLGEAEPDDLKLIVGIGPVLERMLHSQGIGTFRQIARWTDRDVAEFDRRFPEFPGRIVRDQWVTQARALHLSKYGESAMSTGS